MDWITEGVARRPGGRGPEGWDEFAAASGALPGERVLEACARRLAGADREDARVAAMDWDRWETWHISLSSYWQPGPMFNDERLRMTFALLVTHYWSNDAFHTGEKEITPRIHQLNGIPGHLIHGRRDVSGPAITPWKLHQQWSTSKLTIVEDEGHGGRQPVAALIAAVEEIKNGLEVPASQR